MCYCNPKIPLAWCKSNKCQWARYRKYISDSVALIEKAIEKHDGNKFDFCKGNDCWCVEAKDFIKKYNKIIDK